MDQRSGIPAGRLDPEAALSGIEKQSVGFRKAREGATETGSAMILAVPGDEMPQCGSPNRAHDFIDPQSIHSPDRTGPRRAPEWKPLASSLRWKEYLIDEMYDSVAAIDITTNECTASHLQAFR